MERHSIQLSGPILGNKTDINLYHIMQTLRDNYWAGTEGVYNFQFLNNSNTLVNTSGPMYFQLLRYSPTWTQDPTAWTISMQGRLNNDGTIEYAEGIKGKLHGDKIFWQPWWYGGNVWKKVNFVPPATNPLDLDLIDKQARIDSEVIENIMEKNYYY